MSSGTRGVVASARAVLPGLALLAPLALLAGCSSAGDAVEVTSPSLPAAQDAACRDLVADLPGTLAQEPSRPVTPRDAPGAAWGDPPIVLSCGAEVPREFNEFSSCVQAEGVGWFVPEEQQDDQAADVTWTAVGHRPVVRVDVPAAYRPEGAAAVIAELAAPVKRHLELVQPCR